MIFLGWGLLVGAILGSLALALAERSLKENSFWGRSYCTHCKTGLKWYDLLPILSYLLLRGRCRYCQKSIAKKYLVVEVSLGVLIALLFWRQFTAFPGLENLFYLSLFSFDLLFKTFFITVLAILTITDLEATLIPDRIIIPSLYLGVGALSLITIYKIIALYLGLSQNPLGKYLLQSDYFYRHALITAQPVATAVISGFLIALFFLVLIIITRGRGMGGGDVKLGAFIGLGLGSPNSILAIILAFISGAIYSLALILFRKKTFGQTIAFGPFLVIGAIITLFFGDQIVSWYIKSFG